ncbi:MAG: flagellar hook-associated protein FlgK [Selenomonadaceae bacterium]|nr:flagellar hook-associated protein FlgK [Selenomonadaceae bacterium]
MAMFAGLNTMIRGIYVNQTALNTTGHNIVNADTDGYSRQSVNVITTTAENRSGVYGNVAVGTGAEVQAVTRSRDIYADVQFRDETATKNYYETLALNFDKLETIFNDSNNEGLQSKILEFYKAWVDLSTESSNASNRVNAIEKGKNLADNIITVAEQLQEQIDYNYYYMEMNLKEVSDILDGITKANRLVVSYEASGASANDLRDQRDLLVDRLSGYIPVKIYEDQYGNYQITSGGTTLVNGVDRLHLDASRGIESKYFGPDYGITDYSIAIRESNVVFQPSNGTLKANLDAIDDCKNYLTALGNLAGFLLTTFNDQHKQGYDLYGEQQALTKWTEVNDEGFCEEKQVYVYAADTAGNFNKVTDSEGKVTYERVDDGTGAYSIQLVDADQVGTNDTVKVSNAVNFYGENGATYTYDYNEDWGVNVVNVIRADGKFEQLSCSAIIHELKLNEKFSMPEAYMYVAAATAFDNTGDYSSVSSVDGINVTDSDTYYSKVIDWGERTGDGTNAVYLSELFNMSRETILTAGRSNAYTINRYANDYPGTINSTGGQGMNSFYISTVTELAVEAESVDTRIDQQDAIMTQVENWRAATSGVDWNEELTNMIKYQKAFVACSRCLNAMDECLDRLVNSTGAVGR